MKKFFFSIVSVVLLTGLLVVTMEGAGYFIVRWRYGHPGKSYGIFMHDPEIGFIHRPNSYNSHTSLNNYGLRNREDVSNPKPSQGLRILAVGGSTTFGYNLTDDETYTELLEKRLRTVPGLEKTQVLNAGTISYSASHNLIRLKRLLPALHPDYVLIYEGLNENLNEGLLLMRKVKLDPKEKKFGLISTDFLQGSWLWTHSILLKWLDYRLKMLQHPPEEMAVAPTGPVGKADVDEWQTENFKWALREMIRACRAHHARPIIIRYATVPWALEGRYFSDLSAAVAKEEGIPVLDFERFFDRFGNRRVTYFIHTGVHLTPAGAEILAQQLFEMILKEHKKHA